MKYDWDRRRACRAPGGTNICPTYCDNPHCEFAVGSQFALSNACILGFTSHPRNSPTLETHRPFRSGRFDTLICIDGHALCTLSYRVDCAMPVPC